MKREERATIKRLDKVLTKIFRINKKTYGIKVISGIIYRKVDDFFFIVIPNIRLINGAFVITGMVSVKPYYMDDLLWEVFDMGENKNAPMSLRANGAFTAPEINIENYDIILRSEEEIEKSCAEFIDKFNDIVHGFSNEVIDIESYYNYLNKSELRISKLHLILLDIQRGNIDNAFRNLIDELSLDNSGGLATSGPNGIKDIYQYAKEYCESRM